MWSAVSALHALPHAPQWLTVVSATSQPSPGLLLQSARPAAHAVTAQTPPAHWVAPTPSRTGHAKPHDPQWAAVAKVSVSQPSAALPLQSP